MWLTKPTVVSCEMKIFFLASLFTLVSIGAAACDEVLQNFPRDCHIQDRFVKLKADLQAKGVEVNEVAEYRVLRFIDRPSWEKAKLNRTPPLRIYEPAPATWQVWDAGIRQIFERVDLNFTDQMFSDMNRELLVNGMNNIKDPNTDHSKKPGEFRTGNDLGIGFCYKNVRDSSEILKKARNSNIAFQQRWEKISQMSVKQLVRDRGGQNPEAASLAFGMSQSANPNCTAPDSWVNFIPTTEVAQQLSWLHAFTAANLQMLSEKRSALSPIELAAFVQRWFVTVHPFSDGNGRTSRAVEDVLLGGFNLPFAPAGDLYNDATTEWPSYLEQTYKTTESMLTVLEYCSGLNYTLQLASRPFYCATVEELNRN